MKRVSKKKLKEIAERYNLADIYVFGSQVSGFSHPGSDFDIGVRFIKKLPSIKKRTRVYGDLYVELSSCFKKENLDLVFIQEAPLHIRYKILTQGELIYTRDQIESCNYLEKTVLTYNDYKYFIDEFHEGILEFNR